MRTRAAIFALVAAAHVALLLLILQPRSPVAASGAEEQQSRIAPTTPREPASTHADQQPGKTPAAASTSDASAQSAEYAHGVSWYERQRRAQQASRQARFGAELSAMLAQPMAMAWPALLQRAHDGDVRATAALYEVARECMYAAPQASDNDEASYGFILNLREGALDRNSLDFLTGAFAARRQEVEAYAPQCGAVEGELQAFFDGVRDQSGTTDPYQQFMRTMLDESAPPPGTTFADLRAAGVPEAEVVSFATWMLQSGDDAAQAQALAFLMARAETDRAALFALVDCLSMQCAALANTDPQRADRWRRSVASAGDYGATADLTDALLAQGHTAEALAWARFALQRALVSCGDAAYAITPNDLGGLYTLVQSLHSQADADQRRAADLMLRTLAGGYPNAACTP